MLYFLRQKIRLNAAAGTAMVSNNETLWREHGITFG